MSKNKKEFKVFGIGWKEFFLILFVTVLVMNIYSKMGGLAGA